MSSPLLSVVIPTWNRARLVCEAVDSALNQRPGEVEVIVVDDDSTDETADQLARTYGSRIHLLRQARRRGPGAARNAGLQLARGELVSFLDSDDVWLPGKLNAELRVFDSFPEADAVVSDSRIFLEGEANDQSRFALNGLLVATQGRAGWVSECEWLWTNSMNSVHTPSITLRRASLARIGEPVFAEDLVCCEDWEFQMRLYHLCRVVVLPEIWTWIRRFDDDSRLGRAVPGNSPTRDQEVLLLRNRLKVMERSHWLSGLQDHLALEFERFRTDTARQLSELVAYEPGTSVPMSLGATGQ